MQSNISIIIRLVYSENELNSTLSEIQNVLKFNFSPHCVLHKSRSKKNLDFTKNCFSFCHSNGQALHAFYSTHDVAWNFFSTSFPEFSSKLKAQFTHTKIFSHRVTHLKLWCSATSYICGAMTSGPEVSGHACYDNTSRRGFVHLEMIVDKHAK